MATLWDYASAIVTSAGRSIQTGEVFAKLLSANDDSGRHGVLIPTDAYSFFPRMEILDSKRNETVLFQAFDTSTATVREFAYKYYQRYPERRITRLNTVINDVSASGRLVVILHATHSDGTSSYYVDVATTKEGERFDNLYRLLFGQSVGRQSGGFVVRPVESGEFSVDNNLADLLAKFDKVKSLGWIDSLRVGPTGIGYTFESLLGIKENNDQTADFKGIEIKCKGVREGLAGSTGKINLFQAGPTWHVTLAASERIRLLGTAGDSGLYTCYSQVTTRANNLNLLLEILPADQRIDLAKSAESMGYWTFAQLERRLSEKHARAVFVKAEVRQVRTGARYAYTELVYCERPTIARFVELLAQNRIVFEFTMSERPDGAIRNHGYPWRLLRAELLDQLFSFQIQLR